MTKSEELRAAYIKGYLVALDETGTLDKIDCDPEFMKNLEEDAKQIYPNNNEEIKGESI